MTTAIDLIQDALEQLGVYAPGETISEADAARVFFVLNATLDEMAAQNIFIYQLTPLTANLVVNKAAYTIGPNSADITSARPSQITYGQSAASATISATLSEVNVVSAIEYQALLANAPLPGRPDTAWYNPTYPLGTLNLLPAPSAVGTLIFQAWFRIVQFATLSQDYEIAVGVLDGLRDNLAVAAKAYFTSAQLDPIIAARAMVARDFLRYQAQTSRAMFNRFTLASNPAKAN